MWNHFLIFFSNRYSATGRVTIKIVEGYLLLSYPNPEDHALASLFDNPDILGPSTFILFNNPRSSEVRPLSSPNDQKNVYFIIQIEVIYHFELWRDGRTPFSTLLKTAVYQIKQPITQRNMTFERPLDELHFRSQWGIIPRTRKT